MISSTSNHSISGGVSVAREARRAQASARNGSLFVATDPRASIGLLRTMMRSREFDRRAGMLCRQGKAWFHISSAGHEALAGAGRVLRSADLIFPHYRDRALLMSRGMSIADMARDLLATGGSHSGGRNMGAHFSDRPHNAFSIASPVGSQCLPAVGAAWARQRQGSDDIVVCSVGEASARQGEFFEAVAFALDHRLPVIFLVSDNGYGISTPTRHLAPVHLPMLHESLVVRVDGVDPDAIASVVATAAADARAGGGPVILWCDLDRLDSHTSSDDHRVYRDAEEIANMRDPVTLFAEHLIAQQWMTNDELAAEWAAAGDEVEHEMAAVIDEPSGDVATIGAQLFAATRARTLHPERRRDTIVGAVNAVLRRGLAEYPEMMVFGEDIEDPKGGVFGFTKSLGTASGGRVFNSPLAEATILGVGVGLAAAGQRPVLELQFIDFIGPAWNQLSNQVTTLRWRTLGAWSCPLVIYAPYGGYLPGGGIWHSQSNEALFTHLPGLRVAVAGTPADAEAIFLDAFAAADPTLILLPKHLMRIHQTATPTLDPDPGGARVVLAGSQVTVASWGNGVELATRAAAELAAQDISIELIDLRWLVPCDIGTVARSLQRTGRLVVVQEDNRTSSFGASLITQLISDDDLFCRLLSPPRLVARDDLHVPFHPDLERAVLPSIDDVVRAVLSTLA